MTSPEPFDIAYSSLTSSGAGARAAALPADPLGFVLDDLASLLTPPSWPPAISGAAIWDDIWNAVKRLVSFPEDMIGWAWDRVQDVSGFIWDAADWLWDNAISPRFTWTWGIIETWAEWVWDQVRPAFDWTWGVTEVWARWVWDQVRPALQWPLGAVETWARWVWDQVSPAFDWTWGIIETWAEWVWDQVRPAFDWTWGVTEVWARWVWDQVRPALAWPLGAIETWARWVWDQVSPAFEWLWDNVLTRIDNWGATTVSEITNLGETVVNTGIQGAQAIGAGFENALRWLFQHVFDDVADAIAVKISIPRKLVTGQYETIEDLLDDIEDPFPMGGISLFLLSLVTAVTGLLPAMMDIGRIQFQESTQAMAKAVGLTIPTFADLRDGMLRGIMPEEDHDEWLGRAGFSEENIEIIKQLYFDLPTPADFTRMVVREVFNPELRDVFGQGEELDAVPMDLASQIGLSPEVMEWHWRAHWALVSVGQAEEMLQRALDDAPPGNLGGTVTIGGETFNTVFSLESFRALLKAQDVMPAMREPLTAIAYRVASRIDIRRMYRTGVVDRREVLRTYLSLGYEPPVALALTEYVTREASGVDKDAPRETIVAAYRDRLMLREPAEIALAELEFSPEVIALFLDQADFAVQKLNTALAEDIVEADVKAGAISDAAARTQLLDLGLPQARIDLLLELWGRKSAVRTSGLSASQLLRLHREGLMEEPTLRERLSLLGYNEVDVGYLVQLAPPEAPAEPRALTQGQARAALRAGLIGVGEFTDRLGQMGYPPEDVSILVDLAQPAELVQVKALTVSHLQRAFRQGFIDEAELRQGLSNRGYLPDDVDVLVDLAQPAVAVRARELTVAQLQRAFRQGLISATDLEPRLLEMGYQPEAAALLVELARPPEEAQARELSVSQLQRALRGDLLTEAEVQSQLTTLGYSAGAVSVLVALARPEELVEERDLTVAQDQRAFREGLMTEAELRARLTDMGFSALDVGILVELARPAVE